MRIRETHDATGDPHLRTLSILGFIAAILAAVALWQMRALLATEWLAQGIQLAAVLLMLWARWTFGWRSFHARADPTAGGLVTTGPYRYLRHPIYAAVLFFVWAGVLTHWGVKPLLLALTVTLGLGMRMWTEERLVAERYPEYPAYAARTRRVIPWLL